MNQLKDCPFCGHYARKLELRQINIVHTPTYCATLGCDNQNGCGAAVSAVADTPEEAWKLAKKQWNRRKREV